MDTPSATVLMNELMGRMNEFMVEQLKATMEQKKELSDLRQIMEQNAKETEEKLSEMQIMVMESTKKSRDTTPAHSSRASPVNTPTITKMQDLGVTTPDPTPTTRQLENQDKDLAEDGWSLLGKARKFNADMSPMMLEEQDSRRLSNFELVRETVDTPKPASLFDVAANNTTVYIQSEDYKKIRWKTNKLDAFLNFCEEVNDYDMEHEKKIPSLYTRMSREIRVKISQALYRINKKKFKQHGDFVRATRQEIIRAVQFNFLPTDRNEFLSLLREACEPYKVDVVDYDFSECATLLNTLRLKFVERYNFLKQACEIANPQAIPSIGFKDGCLFNAFLDLTPAGSRAEYKTLLYDRAGKDLNEFLDAYFALVDSTFEKSKGLLVYCKRNGIKVPTLGANTASPQNMRFSKSQRYEKGSFMAKRNVPVVNMIEESDGDAEDEWLVEEGEDQVNSDKSEEDSCDDHDPEMYAVVDQRRLRPNGDSRNEHGKNQQVKAQNTHVKAQNAKKTICHYYEQNGSCLKGNGCRFSHDRADILEYRKGVNQRYFKEIKGMSTQHKGGVAMIEEAEEECQLKIIHQPDATPINLISELFRVTKDASRWIASHKAAEIVLDEDDRVVTVNAALFDSGANNDNYISEDFVNLNGLTHLLEKTNTQVEVADGKVLNIKEKIVLDIRFRDSGMNEHAARIRFMVFPGLMKDLIIGFRTIVMEFSDLFKEMIDEAKQRMEKSGSLAKCYTNPNNQDEVVDMYLMGGCYENYLEGAVNPWTKPVYDVAPEEYYIPDPSSYGDVLCFMEVPVEQAREEFMQELATRVEPEFAKRPGVMDLLRTKGMQVFVPETWEGIKGYELDLDFKDNLPARLKPKARPIPPAMLESVNQEIKRLLKYFWEPSTSSITSPLVVAAKATAPFIRICGDFRVINKYIVVFNYPIPNVIHELHKAKGFAVFIDLDIKNAFHQIKLSAKTAAMLSVQTPVGQYQPKFLPEGVAPASGFLMFVMFEIFRDYLDFMVVIFDNLLICAYDYDDAFIKLEKVLDRCIEKNIYLKLSKCLFGVKEVTFFGYRVNGTGFYLSEERRDNISKTPFPEAPKQTKKMQAFLGAANYFKMFIPLYSDKTALLTDMIHKDFVWDPNSWKEDYRAAFENLKLAIAAAQTAYHPDYSLQWVLCVDASDFAIGGVLFQIPEGATAEKDFQVIAFVSKKLSGAARNWSIIEKECFSIFYSVKKLSYYLFGKAFTIKTDHYNLLWMESSEIPKIIRMRVYLQSFNFTLKHIKGRDNVFADFLSRMYAQDKSDLALLNYVNMSYSNSGLSGVDLLEINSGVTDSELPMPTIPASVDDAIRAVHNARLGHGGAVRTYAKLKKFFPGSKIPIRYVEDFVRACPVCQKLRLDMRESIPAPLRYIDPEHCRQFCSFDTLYVSPADDDGNMALHCVRMFPSRLIGLYPVKNLEAEGVALSLFQYFVTYGITDILISDPGSNINAEVVKMLLSWFGIRLRMSLTNRHQSSLIERSHRETLRFLSDLVHEERVIKVWAKPHILGIVQFMMNSEVSKEIGISPFHYTFGDVAIDYFRLPDLMSDKLLANQFINTLNAQFKMIREVAVGIQRQRQMERVADGRNETDCYQPGDYILKRQDQTKFKTSKLSPNYFGPYQVVSTHKADVTVRDLVKGVVNTFHMDELKPFFGTDKEAFEMALRDQNQYVMGSFLGFKGNPLKRKSCDFYVLFEDGDKLWLPWSKDLADTAQYLEFCSSRAFLYPLTLSARQWNVEMLRMNKEGISSVRPGIIFYMDLRYYGVDYYEMLDLPDKYLVSYVVECQYSSWKLKGLAINVQCKIFNQNYVWNSAIVFLYGTVFELNPTMILVDNNVIAQYPSILKG